MGEAAVVRRGRPLRTELSRQMPRPWVAAVGKIEPRLVTRVVHIAGYNRFSFTRASAVVNCQSALACFLLRLSSQAATS